jgi:hypothetical protein
MRIVPLIAVPSQRIKTVLADQIVELDVYQLRYGMFINVYVNSVLEIGAVICQNLNRIIRSAYLNEKTGFSGDFVFQDTQGTDDPIWTGLGDRFQLLYLTQAELESMGLAA